jgi:hypothetical protein
MLVLSTNQQDVQQFPRGHYPWWFFEVAKISTIGCLKNISRSVVAFPSFGCGTPIGNNCNNFRMPFTTRLEIPIPVNSLSAVRQNVSEWLITFGMCPKK